MSWRAELEDRVRTVHADLACLLAQAGLHLRIDERECDDDSHVLTIDLDSFRASPDSPLMPTRFAVHIEREEEESGWALVGTAPFVIYSGRLANLGLGVRHLAARLKPAKESPMPESTDLPGGFTDEMLAEAPAGLARADNSVLLSPILDEVELPRDTSLLVAIAASVEHVVRCTFSSHTHAVRAAQDFTQEILLVEGAALSAEDGLQHRYQQMRSYFEAPHALESLLTRLRQLHVKSVVIRLRRRALARDMARARALFAHPDVKFVVLVEEPL